jgi:hypothetical protein
MTELDRGTMLIATNAGGINLWKWDSPQIWKFWKWGKPQAHGKVELDTIYWKSPSQQIASIAALPNRQGLVVADSLGTYQFYPDRKDAIARGCKARQQTLKEESENLRLKPVESAARNACRKTRIP